MCATVSMEGPGDPYDEPTSIKSLLRHMSPLMTTVFTMIFLNADYEEEEPVIVVAEGKVLDYY